MLPGTMRAQYVLKPYFCSGLLSSSETRARREMNGESFG